MTRPPASRRLRSAIFHALRWPFRLLPVSEARRDALRNWFFDRYPRVRPIAPQGQIPTGPMLERRPRVHSGGRAIGYVEYSEEPLPDPLPATLVAFYLPQFHTIPENDAWWGKGFTEWRNVARALPQFEGHQQPRLPGDLGFYDLRNPQVLRDQAKLAQTYGISAFCMYFYWFGGKTLLELPHQQWLNDPSITLPICICWANENWTRAWDGRSDEILIAQQHSPEDDLAFIAHVAQYLRDPRYLRHDGKPMLLLYRPGLLPDVKATATRWRTWCRDNGIGEIHLAYVQSFERPDPRDIGFDAAVEFPPNLSTAENITDRQILLNPDYQGEVLDWRDVADDFAARPLPQDYLLFPGVNCGWDNEARRPGHGRTYLHTSARAYRQWLRETIHGRLQHVDSSMRMVFINAWNEWAEGAALEPDNQSGHESLLYTRYSLRLTDEELHGTLIVIHAFYPDILREMIHQIEPFDADETLIVTTTEEKHADVRAIIDVCKVDACIIDVNNRGRDILPFLAEAARIRSHGVDAVVLKLHTKRSPHLESGEMWRRELVDRLALRERRVLIRAAYARWPNLGLVVPNGHVLRSPDHLGANEPELRRLETRLGMTAGTLDEGTFVSGSMFWARLSALDPLIDAGFEAWEFPRESNAVDGQLHHAIERAIRHAAIRNHQVVTDDDLVGDGQAGSSTASANPYGRALN